MEDLEEIEGYNAVSWRSVNLTTILLIRIWQLNPSLAHRPNSKSDETKKRLKEFANAQTTGRRKEFTNAKIIERRKEFTSVVSPD